MVYLTPIITTIPIKKTKYEYPDHNLQIIRHIIMVSHHGHYLTYWMLIGC